MEFQCPKCGAITPTTGKFCKACGHNLTLPSESSSKELSFDEKIAKIQKFLPKGLTEKILNQKEKIEGERKLVTVMFCDMEGFTTLVERLGPEEAYSIMDQIYEILIHKVHDYEGTVNEMTGDGIMALFGAPIALEDAPQRAIRSAYSIHREMAKFNDKINQEREIIPPVKMRIGIHSGPVVVGTLGNDLRLEFKAVGDTVNLASRMEGLAEPGTTCVTGETYKITEGFFRFEALGEKEIKGKKEPVKVYRVIAPSSRRTRFDVSAERGLTPFVGRDRELELLLDGFEHSKRGQGQAFSILSEAGVGKSRLLYEFRKAVSNEDVTFLEGKCLSYSRSVAYHPIVDILKSNFDIREGDVDREIKEKAEKGLKILGADEVSTLPYLLELLSVKDSGIDNTPISPEAKKDRIIEALKRIVVKGSEIRPLIMAIEDLHWVDKSSEEVLKYLLESIPGIRVFLVLTYRPEFGLTWGTKSYHNQLTLNRLSSRESLAMVSHILASEKIDTGVEDLILQKTEGIPFFVEELVRSLKNLGIIERKDNKYHLARNIQDLTIPSTIHDVIMARVDLLPEGAKEVLQCGSVIEREFGYELIKRVTGLPEQELLSQLYFLKASEHLYERGAYPESTYIFQHALTREVVYDSILTRKKKKLHSEIGNAIEELYEENISEHYGLLAEHFIESENYEKGAEYTKLAGKKAQKAGSFRDALEHAKRRVLCLEKLPKTETTQRKIIDARTVLAGCNMNLSRHVEAKEAVEPIVDLALEMNYQKRVTGIYTVFGTYHLWVDENYSKGFQYLNQVLEISEARADFFSLWYANLYLGLALSWNCQFKKGLSHIKVALRLGEAANNILGIVNAKSNISAYIYTSEGKIDLAYQASKESLSIAEQSDDIYVKGLAYASHGSSCYYKGSFDEAETSLLKGLSLCEKMNQLGWWSWASGTLGNLYEVMGEYEKALQYYKIGVSILEDAMLCPSWRNTLRLDEVAAKVLNGDRNISLDDPFEYFRNINLKYLEGWKARRMAEIVLDINDKHISNSEKLIREAIQADNRNCTMWQLAKDYAFYAELLKRKGDQSNAIENLSKAIEIFKECGADGWVKKYEEEMASLL
jgi:class 3 adenylate cyclase/tetratricopeptide (TPR) repeat protein